MTGYAYGVEDMEDGDADVEYGWREVTANRSTRPVVALTRKQPFLDAVLVRLMIAVDRPTLSPLVPALDLRRENPSRSFAAVSILGLVH